jgi:hypothetical protein
MTLNKSTKKYYPSTLKNFLRGARQQSEPSYFKNLRSYFAGSAPVSKPNSGSYIKAIDVARQVLTEDAFPTFIDKHWGYWRKKHPQLTLGKLEHYHQLRKTPTFTPLCLEREIAWSAGVLQKRIPTLKRFHSLLQSLQENLLKEDYAGGHQALDQIDDVCGVSFWSIEARIALFQLQSGLERHKAYVGVVYEGAPGSFAAYIAYMVSRRNEEASSTTGFLKDLESQIAEHDLDNDLAKYLRYRLTGVIHNVEDCASILAHELSTSLVDLYEAFITTLTLVSSRNPLPNLLNLIRPLTKIGDERLIKIAFLLGETAQLNDLAWRDLAPYKAILQGDYSGCVQVLEQAIDSNQRDFKSLILLARCHAQLESNLGEPLTLLETLLGCLQGLFQFRSDYTNCLATLAKIKMNLRVFPVINSLCGFPSQMHGHDLQKNRELWGELFVNDPKTDPFDIVMMSGDQKQFYQELGSQHYNSNATFEGITSLLNSSSEDANPLSFSEDEKLLIEAFSLQASGMDSDATVVTDKMLSSHNRLVKLEGVCLKARSLAKSATLKAFMDLCAFWCTREDVLTYILPIAEVLGNRSLKAIKPDYSSLSTSITFHLLLRNKDDNKAQDYLRWSCDEFLESHKLTRPSKLLQILEQFDRPQVGYFLSEVCKPQILEACRHLRKTKDLEEERINICTTLMELDFDHVEAYQQEIMTLSTKLSVDAGIQLLDRSRVFVNTSGIRRWATRELGEIFARCKALLTTQKGIAAQVEKIIQKLLTVSTDKGNILYINPYEEADKILLDLIQTLRHQFLNSPDYGLDSFLSMRIRHGTIAGTLRGPADDLKLLTTRDASGKYQANEYWLSRIYNTSPEQRKKVKDHLMWFSESYDSVIELLVKPSLQIRSEKKSKGLFKVELDEKHILQIRTALQDKPESTLDEFTDVIFDYFHHLLNADLQTVRDYLERDVKSSFEGLFKELQERLAQSLRQEQYVDLKDASAEAFTRVQNTLLRIIDWFHLENSLSATQSFSIEEVCRIAIGSAMRALVGFEPEIQIYSHSEQTMGASVLEELSDILFVALENVSRHSGISEKPLITVTIEYNSEDSMLYLDVVNPIASYVKSAASERKLETIKAAIRDGSYKEQVQSEGGSGLMKLQRNVSSHPRHKLDFGFLDDQHFYIHIGIPITLAQHIVIPTPAKIIEKTS